MTCLNTNNNYKFHTSCCNKYICCFNCHQLECPTYFNRYYHIKYILCSKCNTKNEFDHYNNCYNYCIKCNNQFSKKFCQKCFKYTDKNIFYCEKCNKCYLHHKSKYKHCDECNKCFNLKIYKNHKCSIMKNFKTCPICLNDLFRFNDKTKFLKCSHLIHESCLNQLKSYTLQNNIHNIVKCTLCSMSIDYNSDNEIYYDDQVASNKVSESRQHWKSEYLCFDCHDKNITKYHYYYHKCLKCKSYNTNVLNTIKNST